MSRLTQSEIEATALKAMEPFNALYESGYFARVAAGEDDGRLATFRAELYAEQFDAEYDAKCQAADDCCSDRGCS